jgi:hypothetical protein
VDGEATFRDEFFALMKKLGRNVRSSAAVLGLLDELGVPHGRSSRDMLPGQWEEAVKILKVKFSTVLGVKPEGTSEAEVVGEQAEAQSGAVGSSAASESATAPGVSATGGPPVDPPLHEEEDDELATATEPEAATAPPIPARTTLQVLTDTLMECRRLWGAPDRMFLREWPDGKKDYWLVDGSLLKETGFDPKKPQRLAALSEQTLFAILAHAQGEAKKLAGGKR